MSRRGRYRACSAALSGLLLAPVAALIAPSVAAPTAAADPPKCPARATYCSPRSLFLPPLDGSGSALVGSSAAGDGDVLSMAGSMSYLPGSVAGTFDASFTYQSDRGIGLSAGVPFALVGGDGHPARPTAALAAGLRVPILQPTADQFGGGALHALLRAQTPELPSEGASPDAVFDLRALGSFRFFIVNLQATAGILLQPGRPGEIWHVPLGGAMNVYFAPPSWNDDERPRLFFETLHYLGEPFSHAFLAGLAWQWRNGSVGLGAGWSKLEGTDSLFLRLSWTARTRIGDGDGDGVPDEVDRCRSLKEDKDSHEDEDGCPDLDDDGDGIPDLEDSCPEEAGTAPDGCPKSPHDAGPLQFTPRGLDSVSATRLHARLSPEVGDAASHVYVASERAGAARAATQAIEDLTGRTGAASVVTPDGLITLKKLATGARSLKLASVDAGGTFEVEILVVTGRAAPPKKD